LFGIESAVVSPATNYQGYLISVSVLNSSNNVADSGSSAIDVSSDWSGFPHYGYRSRAGGSRVPTVLIDLSSLG
jgi:hypothetical protein